MRQQSLLLYFTSLSALTIPAAVATIETTVVDVCRGVSSCSVPERTFDVCRLYATSCQLVLTQYVLPIQTRVLYSLNLKTKSV